MTHELKIWPEYFAAVASGRKSFELRRDDRMFDEGDLLILREYLPREARYTGATIECSIAYVLRDAPQFGLKHGFAILGLGPVVSAVNADGITPPRFTRVAPDGSDHGPSKRA